MKGLPFVLLFTAMTFVAWGAYGPVLHHGAVALEHDSMRAFVGVGLAYFLIAVIFPVLILRAGKEKGNWTILGVIYSLVAGAVGAVGALGIILALGYGGQTLYVMPLVFGFAPVVNTLVTALLSRTFNQISAIFILGIVTAALGAGGVLYFKPSPQSVAKENSAAETAAEADAESGSVASSGVDQEPMEKQVDNASEKTEANQDESADSTEKRTDETDNPETNATDEETAASSDGTESGTAEVASTESEKSSDDNSRSSADEAQPSADSLGRRGDESYVVRKPVSDEPEQASNAKPRRAVNIFMVAVSIVIAALCWGSYGPMLHIGQGKMNGSRLRPFTCVGLAYFFIAVAAPIFVIYSRAEDTGAWTAGGMTWSFLAGVAGAVGALGVILAFNAGGKPYYVMPLIFGFAPVINTFISLTEAGTWGQASPMFWISLAVVITGAVTVLTNAPKPKPKPSPAT